MMNARKNQNISKNMANRLAFVFIIALAGIWYILAPMAVHAATPYIQGPDYLLCKITQPLYHMVVR